MEYYNNISDYSSIAGVFNYDTTPIPVFCYERPKRLTSADKGAIFLLALRLQKQQSVTSRAATVVLKKMQKEGDFPLVTIHSKWLVKFAVEAAQSL